jgi:L,D-transpeptidase YbiS
VIANDQLWIKVIAKTQTLLVLRGDVELKSFPVSTSKFGLGERKNSFQTPRGWHEIRAKIGDDCPINTVFVRRRPTGEVYSPILAAQFPQRDWILTRILWLGGLEVEKNRLGAVDTMQRFIYIHGTPDTNLLGIPASHGCIRMHNSHLLEVFSLVTIKTRVLIVEQ